MMLTYVTTYYENPTMLRLQYLNWTHWPHSARTNFRIVVVDDGSPKHPAIDVQRPGGLPVISIYRAKKDTPWHQDAARNLGVHAARDGWLLLTDIDHMLEPDAALALIRVFGKLDARRAYRLARREVETREPTIDDRTGQPKPHPNSYVLTKKAYVRVGGFDERYCGIYGTDGKFKAELLHAGYAIDILRDVPLTRYSRKFVPDASCNLSRDKYRDDGRKKKRLDETPQDRTFLDFEWEQQL